MKWLKSRIVWGSLLVVFGILVLLQNFGLFTLGGITAAILFSFGGVFFISLYIDLRERWWSLIPGFTLLSIALSMVASLLAPPDGRTVEWIDYPGWDWFELSGDFSSRSAPMVGNHPGRGDDHLGCCRRHW